MEKLTIKELAPYLPYGLKVQYKGIINRKELSEHSKIEPKFNDSNDFLNVNPEWEKWDKNKPKEVIGDRISEIKQIKFFKEYITFHVGTYHNYLKTVFYDDFKPILRPLSDLTKEIEVNGERFVPEKWLEENINNTIVIYKPEKYDIEITIESENYIQDIDLYQGYVVMTKLFEWHFDVFGLIEKNLAIDINTLNQKP